MSENANQFLERIPDEQEVRARLADNIREAAVLRALLRVAKRKTEAQTKDRSQRQVMHA